MPRKVQQGSDKALVRKRASERHRRETGAAVRDPQRAAEVLRLRARGLTITEISKQLRDRAEAAGEPTDGYSVPTIDKVLKGELSRLADDLRAERAQYWALALERLEQAIRFHQSVMLNGELGPDVRGRAAERMVGVIARQAKMMGFDQGATLKLSDGTASLQLDVASMDDEELTKELKGFLGGVQATMTFIEGQDRDERHVEVGMVHDAEVVEDDEAERQLPEGEQQ